MVATNPQLTVSNDRGTTLPVPDPTELTDRAIAKSSASTRDYIDGQLLVRDERMRGIDTATTLRLQTIDNIPGVVDDKVESLHRLVASELSRLSDVRDQKFESIATQFKERDTRSERESQLNKIALDAAFSASKEAVAAALTAQKEAAARQDEANAKAIDKSEKATAETIKTNQELSATRLDALTKSLDEVKFNVTRGEGRGLGQAQVIGYMVAAAGVAGVVVGIIVKLSGSG